MILKSSWFYSHVNYSVTKIISLISVAVLAFYSHVNYSVTKIGQFEQWRECWFYSHVNYSVTKMDGGATKTFTGFTVT